MALWVIMRSMKPRSEDLRARIVKAVQEGMSKAGAARFFGAGLFSPKRYVKIANRRDPSR